MEIKKRPAWPIWAAATVFCAYGWVLPMYRVADVLIAAVVSIVALLLFDRIAKPVIVYKPIDPSIKKTGDSSADAVIQAGKARLSELNDLRKRVQNETMRGHIDEWASVGRQIFAFVSENPASAKALSKFMDYYFPQAVKLLTAYAEFEGGQTRTETMAASMARIESAAPNVGAVFKNQLDSLYADKALDIQTDIVVLDSLLKREGESGLKI